MLTPRGRGLIAVTIWGASFAATGLIVQQIDPFALVTIRTLGGTVVLYAMLRLTGRWDGLIRGRRLAYVALLAFVGIFVHLTIQAVGLTMTTASNTGWLFSLSPVFIAVLGWLFLGERFGVWRVAGFVVAMAGALLIVVAQAGGLDFLDLPSTPGDLLALSSAVTWAVYSVLSKRALRQWPAATLMVHIVAMGGLMSVPFFVARQGWLAFGALDAAGWLALGFLVVFVASLGHLFWYDALAGLDASQVAVLLYIEPVITMLVAAVLLGEPIRPLMVFGGAAILVGVWLVNRSPAKPAPDPA
jgi:drug/metabolite transporter (DMT)-like permease